MPYANQEDQNAYGRMYRKKHPEKARAWTATWQRKNRAKKNACNRRHMGEPGSAKREAYNERRRVKRKASALAELEAIRKHRAGLMEFLRRKVA